MALAADAARQYEAIPPGLLTEAVVIVDVPPDRHEDGTGDRGGSGCKGWAAAVSLCNPPRRVGLDLPFRGSLEDRHNESIGCFHGSIVMFSCSSQHEPVALWALR
jgi:hypothetical protein